MRRWRRRLRVWRRGLLLAVVWLAAIGAGPSFDHYRNNPRFVAAAIRAARFDVERAEKRVPDEERPRAALGAAVKCLRGDCGSLARARQNVSEVLEADSCDVFVELAARTALLTATVVMESDSAVRDTARRILRLRRL